jgi:hypothetical protein
MFFDKNEVFCAMSDKKFSVGGRFERVIVVV